ncbi:uncharacterized protein PHACADRAFT_248945 [Phanerochaete carnosa HHB-10118-sp]|uniref:Uncharacterized protein n=1 Tax=Phanerochaete carnosa (strain HHB-10118-sp) TaxID=650164 RepID=K5W4P2_PHACS|nr:uncharacterized protein PHACADRAFT_248945 [Phanerochaete carnosa HHB-10118-sp]EKM58848.1 hypothetical protein PHACADRAFT_248945 [Phanerochaete carnosa HHB-10118-sp]
MILLVAQIYLSSCRGPSTDAGAALSAGYTCKEVQGALLHLKSEAYTERLYQNRRIEAYMIHEHERWCSYVKDGVGHRVEPEDIVLISGWVKTPADWATAAFSNTSKTYEMSLAGQIGQIVGAKLSGSRTRTQSGPKAHRRGTKYSKGAGRNSTKDQSVFVKRYKIKKMLGILRVLIAGAGGGSLPPGDRDPGTVAGVVAEEEWSGDEDLGPDDLGSEHALFSEGQVHFSPVVKRRRSLKW